MGGEIIISNLGCRDSSKCSRIEAILFHEGKQMPFLWIIILIYCATFTNRLKSILSQQL
jgi:hypothetical protein